MTNKKEIVRLEKVVNLLKKEYPIVEIALDHENPFELLVATMLSAQCADARVNMVTKDLFKKYKSPRDYLNVSQEELGKDIFSTGFYNQKSKSIQRCSKQLIDEYNSEVPADFEKLANLSGVGRKTASVVAGNAFGIPAIAVDTHAIRIMNLLGFVTTKDAKKIEAKLKELLPERDWVKFTHWIISHGRKVCIARRPKCLECALIDYCPSQKVS
ncbi:MAG: endonuclease III [Melioribacteraceae bacterium]|jgi:endonuclease-3|nr:endonuclease III [Melioribacteraceae bacterium]